MSAYLTYLVKRALLLLSVVFAGISLSFFVTHFTPINPVETAISRMTSFGNFSPAAVDGLRSALTELYGVDEPIVSQYINFWFRLVRGDLGPSLSAFPTPVMDLVGRALPWTFGLLATATLIAWLVGNLLGGLAGYYQNNRVLKTFGVMAMGVQPIPYYIVAFLLLILFGSIWPILPISGGFAMNVRPGPTWQFALSIVQHSILPALSLVVVGLGTWFLGMRALVSNVVTEDYVTYAELGAVDRSRILGSYVIRNALIPQLTALAMTLGAIFSGTIITEVVFSYPGLGRLLIQAVNGGDYSLVLGVTSISIASVGLAVFIVDAIYPLLDPRIKVS